MVSFNRVSGECEKWQKNWHEWVKIWTELCYLNSGWVKTLFLLSRKKVLAPPGSMGLNAIYKKHYLAMLTGKVLDRGLRISRAGPKLRKISGNVQRMFSRWVVQQRWVQIARNFRLVLAKNKPSGSFFHPEIAAIKHVRFPEFSPRIVSVVRKNYGFNHCRAAIRA